MVVAVSRVTTGTRNVLTGDIRNVLRAGTKGHTSGTTACTSVPTTVRFFVFRRQSLRHVNMYECSPSINLSYVAHANWGILIIM
eukprot:scaffold476511_cov37-Prasinocladus_malaysianus.AAC.1